MYKIDNKREPTVPHRELYSVLCGDLNGKEIQKVRGYIYIHTYIHMADLLYGTAETHHCKATILK